MYKLFFTAGERIDTGDAITVGKDGLLYKARVDDLENKLNKNMDYKTRRIAEFRETFKHSQFIDYAKMEAFLSKTIEEERQRICDYVSDYLIGIDCSQDDIRKVANIIYDREVRAKFEGKEEDESKN